MATAMIISANTPIARRWERALVEAGWDVVVAPTLAAIGGARYRGVDVVVLDAETPAELTELETIRFLLDIPPIVVRASRLAAARALSGFWRGVLHVGALASADLVSATDRLLAITTATPITLPVCLPLAPATKWAVRMC